MAESVTGTAARLLAGVSGLSWLPWAIAGTSAVLALGGAGMGLWYANKYHQCQASVAIDANKAQEMVRQRQAADEEFTRQVAEKLAPIVDSLEKANSNVQIAIAKAKSIEVCNTSDAARAFDNIVRPHPIDEANPR
jgi:hypothetical protein